MAGLKKLVCPCGLLIVLLICGCQALSHPGAGRRALNLQNLAADQETQIKRMHLGYQYMDGQTPMQRLETLYDQTESQLESAGQ